jgi:superoxide dismutase, Cu-Zn family
MLRLSFLTTTTLLAMACAGCSTPGSHHGSGGEGMDTHMASMKGKVAFATLTPTQGNNVRGLFVFHQMGDQVMVHAQVSGLKPNAEHGIHVHEKGDCASADGTSAGGHFNPDGKPHGPQASAHHAGDMPALKADANGVANQKFTLSGPTVSAGAASLVEHAVIVHAAPDDYTTQPTGNSGARIACGVVAGM